MTAVGEITTNAPQNLGSEIQQRVLVGKEVGSNLAREARVANIGQVLGDPIGEQSASFPNIKHTTTGASDSIHHVGATASETPGHCELLVWACDSVLGIQKGTDRIRRTGTRVC